MPSLILVRLRAQTVSAGTASPPSDPRLALGPRRHPRSESVGVEASPFSETVDLDSGKVRACCGMVYNVGPRFGD